MKYTFFIQLSLYYYFLLTHNQLNIFIDLDVVKSIVFFNNFGIIEKQFAIFLMISIINWYNYKIKSIKMCKIH